MARGHHHHHLAGLILARAGSKGIPHKNLATVGGASLVERAVRTVVAAGCFDSVWVSTDSDDIAQCAVSVGALVFRRSQAFAQDTSPSVDAVREFLLARPEVSVVGLVQCTSPFILPEFLERAAERMRTSSADSVFSVTREKKFRWSEADESSPVPRPVDFDPASRPRRQDWHGYLVENGMFYFARRQLVVESGLLQGGAVAYIEIPSEHSLDIDTKMDLIIADTIARRNLLPSNDNS